MFKVLRNLRIKSHLYAIIDTTSAATLTTTHLPPFGGRFKGPSEAAAGGEASDIQNNADPITENILF